MLFALRSKLQALSSYLLSVSDTSHEITVVLIVVVVVAIPKVDNPCIVMVVSICSGRPVVVRE